MKGHSEELPLLGGVAALLGASIVEHEGAGACRVISGSGLVAKIGPPDVVAREAAVLATPLPVSKPVLVATGPGWLVMTAEPDDDGPWAEDELEAALGDLARLHDAFAPGDTAALANAPLRRPFSPEGADLLLEPVRRLRFDLPVALTRVLADPAVLLSAASDEPETLLHGDPWPGNVLRPSRGRRVWIDWEMAGVGPAAADLATWLAQTPWHAGVPDGALAGAEVEIYRSSRSRPVVDRVRFERALHAAAVLWFLAYDVPHLAAAPADRADLLTSAALAALDRLEAS